ncbi:phenylacetate-CoA oxygenase, PaaH subunit [Pseudarthrobacter chlorophenolicus A6]|uniref:Phenylacetate-CoA oxygenase, PaaH subunit n=1 Tax=Pseudarthrobacter chlorophenolicus (strain ATCC 700700 / DSM 12829 / CIP 107037 / JCM 12360 / KCTC 9906 / NCIMB 13794 / A6) TaxID=452863 RepID=B8HEH9_PSECP|nr:1,2-phenylacetyl-CoA epoxidase subunit PaaB [Pseudarthrobacter chlorophenolicus]ACL40924.1 phenylacetate-CoA oxygenase, PaaH subunit [Pseudarthrobacter chlorophenolicus A6]SDQ72778.1 ring-1,2-phenylacetyl-CoA epoxidase subunit PaaB [Pseudarthrobacter chlorophenolicus]
MSPHGNPEAPASGAAEINREAPKASPVVEPREVSTSSTPDGRPVSTSLTPDGRPVSASSTTAHDRSAWGLWEVFVRSSRGLSHVHAGSLHAPDAAMALRNARDLYTRRNEGVSIWVVPADAIAASDPDSKGSFFESPQGKDYRHATYYTKSEGVKHL